MFRGLSNYKMGISSCRYFQWYSTLGSGNTSESSGTSTEQKLVQILRTRFPNASEIYVADVSGGCGAMFDVTIVSPEFKDISLVNQHRLINNALKDEIKQMHGLRISTYHESIHGDKS